MKNHKLFFVSVKSSVVNRRLLSLHRNAKLVIIPQVNGYEFQISAKVPQTPCFKFQVSSIIKPQLQIIKEFKVCG